MSRKNTSVVIILFVTVLWLAGCTTHNDITTNVLQLDARFYGDWKDNTSNTITTFSSDGSVIYSSCGCERIWERHNSTLSIYEPLDSGQKGKLIYESYYTFTEHNTTLMLTNLYDNSRLTYTKLHNV
jgi:hypothetical protein